MVLLIYSGDVVDHLRVRPAAIDAPDVVLRVTIDKEKSV
jgi:hypothetical protein